MSPVEYKYSDFHGLCLFQGLIKLLVASVTSECAEKAGLTFCCPSLRTPKVVEVNLFWPPETLIEEWSS